MPKRQLIYNFWQDKFHMLKISPNMFALHRLQRFFLGLLMGAIFSFVSISSYANPVNVNDQASIDRIQLVTQQINLLKNRLAQAEKEHSSLQEQEEQIPQSTLDKAGKNLLDKASLDIIVSKSNLETVEIELADSQQITNWLEKNIQEIENQLNVLSIFGIKFASQDMANIKEYRRDLHYQQKLLELEKTRIKFLQNLQEVVSNTLALKKDRYKHISTLVKSRKMLHIKQQQAKDELGYQEQQNYWLQRLNKLYVHLAKLDPATSKKAYTAIEREIFYANESASFAYTQSLISRYRDQVEQTKIAIVKSNSISLLNEIGNQIQMLSRQINRLDVVIKTRVSVLDKHIGSLSFKKTKDKQLQTYLRNLLILKEKYIASDDALMKLTVNLSGFRKLLDQALQNELSARQGFPTFGTKMLLNIGKEMLLVPPLTFQALKNLSSLLLKAYKSAGPLQWFLFSLLEAGFIFGSLYLRKQLLKLIERNSQWREQMDFTWIGLQWLQRNFLDLMIVGNGLGMLYFFDLSLHAFGMVVNLALLWLVFKGTMTLSRICLVETTHDTTGHDVKLHRTLRWIILIGGIVTAMTVFVHQLPLIYEIKTLCDNLFMFMLVIVSLLLLRYWDVVPKLVLSHIDSQHPYLEKSICLIGVLIPSLLFINSVIGLLGYVNLIMTVSWYEGIFLVVMVLYMVLRGLLSNGMEQLSRLMIQYVNNGWLWTEAFLKPIDRVFHITLFLTAWAILFLVYGWDKQSPIVERLTTLLHYQLISMLNTTITPLNIIELFIVISFFYWTAKWTREFVYRMLLSKTQDMGIRNSIAILSQYSVVVLGGFFCLRVLGIDLRALAVVLGMFAFGIGWGLRDIANNFVCGFLILLERPLRVGDFVSISELEGEVVNIGSRAVTVRTWEHMELVVPNAEIFNKSFTNWTSKDDIVRSVIRIKISRFDNPHEVKAIIQNVLIEHKDILPEPMPEVFLREMNDVFMEFELRYHVNIRQVPSRISVVSAVLIDVWDVFELHGIKPPYPKQEIFLKSSLPIRELPLEALEKT